MTILNKSQIKNNSIITSDICIIGSGMSGQIVSSTLKDQSLIIVESGGLDFDKNIQSLNIFEQVGLKFRENFLNRSRQLGGSANLWANQLMCLAKDDLINREWVSKNFSWPFDYKEIKSNYEDVINLIYKKNIQNFDIFNSNKKNKSNILDEKLNNFRELDFYNHIWPSEVNKFNLKNDFTKKILLSEKIKFIHNFTATEIIMDNEKQIVRKIKIQSKEKYCYIKSKIFILASGAIENARILLNNQKNNLLNNQNIGRYFMDHPRVNLGKIKTNDRLSISSLFGLKYQKCDYRKSIKFSKKFQTEKKILDAYAFLDPLYSKIDIDNFELFLKDIKKIIKFSGLPKFEYKNFKFKQLIEQIYLKLSPQISSSLLNNFLRKYFEKDNFYFSFKNLTINYQGEQMPNYKSRIYLSDKTDEFNQNKAVIDWQLGSLDYQTQDEFIKILIKLSNSKIGVNFIENKDRIITDASHHSGTTRISNNRNDGVVDGNCKFHDIKNLYISGSSVFRVANSINPGFTNMAMSMRLGKYIKSII